MDLLIVVNLSNNNSFSNLKEIDFSLHFFLGGGCSFFVEIVRAPPHAEM